MLGFLERGDSVVDFKRMVLVHYKAEIYFAFVISGMLLTYLSVWVTRKVMIGKKEVIYYNMLEKSSVRSDSTGNENQRFSPKHLDFFPNDLINSKVQVNTE